MDKLEELQSLAKAAGKRATSMNKEAARVSAWSLEVITKLTAFAFVYAAGIRQEYSADTGQIMISQDALARQKDNV